ncbi:MAG: ATP phosphoribosyltransferase regulatory subunit [Turicibacter sp.]|nr:ATP phosphoribosyltransferase regulatory subunit [Turicibacter sp.]
MNNRVLKDYQMKRKMEDFALAAGYLPYEPSLFEHYDDFDAMSSEVKREQLVTVINGQKFNLLRPDITTIIMNQVRPNVPAKDVLKVFYQSTVYRLLDGDIKAINQFGMEYLGVIDGQCERDVLSLAIAYLQDVPTVFEVGTTQFLNQILQLCALDPQKEKVFRKLVYIKNREELVKFGKLHDLPEGVQAILPQLFNLRGSYKEVVTRLQRFAIGDLLIETLAELAYLNDFDQVVIFDPSMASELTYYDGIIFKGYYRNVPHAVLSGGRYAGNAIGFSIDVDQWLTAQKEEGSAWHI